MNVGWIGFARKGGICRCIAKHGTRKGLLRQECACRIQRSGKQVNRHATCYIRQIGGEITDGMWREGALLLSVPTLRKWNRAVEEVSEQLDKVNTDIRLTAFFSVSSVVFTTDVSELPAMIRREIRETPRRSSFPPASPARYSASNWICPSAGDDAPTSRPETTATHSSESAEDSAPKSALLCRSRTYGQYRRFP